MSQVRNVSARSRCDAASVAERKEEWGYFIDANRKLIAVEVKGSGKSFEAGVSKPLFEVASPFFFDVSKDGRFLIQVPVEQGSANITVVTNWQAGLKK